MKRELAVPLLLLAAAPASPPVFPISGDQGLQPFVYRGAKHGAASIDARGATFTVANSRNPNPDAAAGCDSGTEAVNRYPFIIDNAPGSTLRGALFVGRVPQQSDWSTTYCNSAAIFVRNSPDVIIDGVRITGAWDAVRASAGSSNTRLTRSWLSNVRDDAFEDDFLEPVTIEDTLIDGAFMGLSVKPRRGSAIQPAGVPALSGVLLRLQEFPYKAAPRFGAIVKSDDGGPRVRIDNSVVAISSAGGATWRSYWERTWAAAQGRNNLLLWLSDSPLPEGLVPPPPGSGFRMMQGKAAAQLWTAAKRNWIDCHPDVRRDSADPVPVRARCRADFWGSGR